MKNLAKKDECINACFKNALFITQLLIGNYFSKMNVGIMNYYNVQDDKKEF